LVGGKTVKKIVASDWPVEKQKKIKIVSTVFPTDQSEAELLYFCSLFLQGATRSYLV
jgi:hypothetical protein